jgi:hypothetical protein
MHGGLELADKEGISGFDGIFLSKLFTVGG